MARSGEANGFLSVDLESNSTVLTELIETIRIKAKAKSMSVELVANTLAGKAVLLTCERTSSPPSCSGH